MLIMAFIMIPTANSIVMGSDDHDEHGDHYDGHDEDDDLKKDKQRCGDGDAILLLIAD